jgi:general secretion pathway protein L
LWRPARWGLLALLAVQLAGLNTWAWMTRQQWERQQDSWTQVLQDSFPQVKVVIDAPLQMAREVARLRQGSGQLTPTDLESLLQALGRALPAGTASPDRLNYQDGVLQWPATALDASQKAAFEQALQQEGYALDSQGGTWRLQPREAQP